MNRKEKALVMGFVEYLQSIYGEGGESYEAFSAPANSLLVPMFVGADAAEVEQLPDFGMLGSVMGAPGGGAMQPLMGFDELQASGPLGGMPPGVDPLMGMMG
jgi:hypothetical protein